MASKITKRFVDSVKAPEKGQAFHYDTELQGFGLCVSYSGRKSFFIQYGQRDKRRRQAIGPYGALTVEAAREKARGILAEVASGKDPIAEKETVKGIPTFAQWADDYMLEVNRRKDDSSKDRIFLRKASDRFGAVRLDKLTLDDIQRVFTDMSQTTPIQANRWLASVRACLSAAWRSDKIENNVAMKIRPNPENPARDRVLTDDEMSKLIEAIGSLADPYHRAALTMLIETGARSSEVLTMQWADLDLVEGVWRMPKPKARKAQVLPLAPSTVALLQGLPKKSTFVIPGRYQNQKRYRLREPWLAVKAIAGIGAEADLHIHDLRRSFGLAVARKAGLHIASKLLRHSDIRVTERVYAPLGLAELREAMDRHSAEIIDLADRRQNGKEPEPDQK